MLTLQDGVGGGVGVDGGHVYGRVVGLGHAGQDQAVHAVEQGVGVGIAAVQQVVDVVEVVGVVRREGVRRLVGTGQLAVVAEVVQVLVVLLDRSCGGETGTGAVVLPDRGGWRGLRNGRCILPKPLHVAPYYKISTTSADCL